MIVKSVTRINDHRWDTWVCIDIVYGVGYCPINVSECIESEILKIVNNFKTDEFYNKNTGERTYSKAKYKCECAENPDCREHWIVINDGDD